jgi:transposase-like protein
MIKSMDGLKDLPVNLVGFQKEIAEAVKAGKSLLGKGGVLTALIQETLQAALEGEIEAHMASADEGSANRRNGRMKKMVNSESGPFELETPRDRNGTFEPQIVKKRQTVITEELDHKILGFYSSGMGYQDIAKQLVDLYGYEVSVATISAVTDRLLPMITEWRNRPLEAVYAVVFLDAMFFKTRGEGGKVVTKALYNIMGVSQEGHKDILGFYSAESEGAHFWLGVLNDLKARGVNDILISCVDGLKGFPEAIKAVFPETEIQLCIVHQIRNSLKYIASKDQKPFMRDLKDVYRAPTKELAEHNLLKLEEKWGHRYPMVLKSWTANWDHLTEYFKYSGEIRRLIYTTNPIEGFHRQVRKYTKTKGAFTSENALFKLVYCACQRIKEKWTKPLNNWALTVSQLAIYFPGRLSLELR